MISNRIRSIVGSLRYYVNQYGWPGGFIQYAGETYVRKTKSYIGENIFEYEWDALILLDACRVDLISEVRNEYGFIETIDSFPSLGSSTSEWMEATFTSAPKGELLDTAYICANPFSRLFLDEGEFQVLDEVWQYAWNDKLGTVPPRPVTDRSITVGRESNPQRLLIHYLQPHVPFIGSSASSKLNLSNFGGKAEDLVNDDWSRVRRGDRPLGEVWNDYRKNLRLVLDDVELLLENLEAETVIISSDHGNAVGEFGIYGHPSGVPLRCLREVPWIQTTGSDRNNYSPDRYDREYANNAGSRLSQLGYVD